jgi:hypothetical protein
MWCGDCVNFDTVKCDTCHLSNEADKAPSHFQAKPDNVNHPSHYETGKFECIDVMIETQGVEAVKDFCLCNAFKYLYRHNGKNGVEDIKKAKWYIEKYLELECDQDVKGNTIAEGA